ncbi:SAVMC3_10250 family protein [Kitasatospora sp. NPDC086801]|uniref:SAVMC3_10250 family protein n=1 Tax=Kitasatospora sp. NPDC086801 TaxID=3364066 RepID=UPI00381BEEB3
MREAVYLSAGKLEQFLPGPRRLARTGAFQVTTPFGGVNLDAPAATGDPGRRRHLEQVLKQLRKTARPFPAPDLHAGQWIRFEISLNCVTLRDEYRDLVLFADPAPRENPDHERAPGGRLLMHGSVRHLLGREPEIVNGPELSGFDGGNSIGSTFLTKAGEVVAALATDHDPLAPPPNEPTNLPAAGVRRLLGALDSGSSGLDLSVPMTGFARVTVNLPATSNGPRCLVATPLIVEYAA